MEEIDSLRESLERKITVFYNEIWRDQREGEVKYQKWLENFVGGEKERLNALYLLTKFMYFGCIEIRTLLKSIYRDLYKYSVVEKIRRDNGDTMDSSLLKRGFKEHLLRTRFLGVGNPSESGVHLLYYFRQENRLSKEKFINAYELFSSTYSGDVGGMIQKWANPDIDHLVFLDDFCGDGSQAIGYIKELVSQIKRLNKECIVEYFVLVANQDGLANVKKETQVNRAEAIFELDESFKCFSDVSRFFIDVKEGIDKDLCENLCVKYGTGRYKDAGSPLGFNEDQLMLSFFHNTPNNTLPIFWTDVEWYPVFNRSIKIY